MNEQKTSSGARTGTEKTLHKLYEGKRAPIAGFVILLALYLAGSVIVVKTSRADGAVFLMDQAVSIRSLTGVFSALSNLCIVLIVVFYKKPGFVVSLALLLVQFPMLFFTTVMQGNLSNLSGFFQNLLTIISIVLLHLNNIGIERYQARLSHQALTDRLTELPNRLACSQLMDDLMKHGEKFSVAVLNLNNYTNIRNTMGQKTANALLTELASRLRSIADLGATETSDFITCQSEGEFALIIREYTFDEDIIKTLECYLEAVQGKLTVDGCDYYPAASIGYAEYPSDADDGDALIVCARSALAEANRPMSDQRILRFQVGFLNAERALMIEREIRSALDDGRLFFRLQPQYDIDTHQLIGFEALARMQAENGTVFAPEEFIPVAEEAGIIDKVDYAITKSAAEFFGQLIQKSDSDLTLSVNASVRHLMKNGFLDELRGILHTSGVPAGQLEIEITESIMIDSMEEALQRINEVKEMGLKVAIDDFGTGYSSLSYLNSFPADVLKVDKSFVDQVIDSDTTKQSVAAIISIGHVMGFEVIAEGVEQPEQLEALRTIGCDYIQGFIWGHPMSPEEVETLVVQSAQQNAQ